MSGVELLEQALYRCRENPGGALSAYWIGTAPFITSLFYFWSTMRRGVYAADQLLPASFGVALLWIWMNCWQSLFCHKLRRHISGEQELTWTRKTFGRPVANVAALHGPSLLALPVAAVFALPFPWVYVFFQNSHIFAAEFDLDETASKAREQAAIAPKQNWQLMASAFFLGMIVLCNVLLTILLGAQLIHSVLGIQTALTRSQFAIFDSSVIAVAVAITYLVVDPVMKAAYVIRCFQGEATRTGADLRLILRKISPALLLIIALQFPAMAIPKEQYDHAIDEVLRRPEYSWRQPRTASQPDGQSAIQRTLNAVGDWVERVVQALVDFLRKLSTRESAPRPSPTSETNVRTGIIVASIAILAALGFLAIRYWKRSPKAVMVASTPVAAAMDIEDESITPDQMPEDEWLQLADRLLASGEARLALRALFLSALAQFHREGFITLSRHKTNLEYDRELARRSRGIPHVRPFFQDLVHTFERCWYGTSPADESLVLKLKHSLRSLGSHA